MNRQVDYYAVLGVSRDASQDEIEKARNVLVKKYHPDRPDGSQEKFHQIQKAYEVLSDVKSRAAYDRFGGTFNDYLKREENSDNQYNGHDNLANFFNNFFSSPFKSKKEEIHGEDLRHYVTLDLEDIYHGCKIDLTIPTNVICGQCNGKCEYTTCPACDGVGRHQVNHAWFEDLYCSHCHGQQKVLSNKCCKGGRVYGSRNINIVIPSGAEQIVVKKGGEAGAYGGRHGDLYVIIQPKKHPIFTKEKDDVVCEIYIPTIIAATSGNIHVPCIDKTIVEITISEGTQNNDTVIIPKKGFNNGNMRIIIKLETPIKLTLEQKDMLTKMQKTTDSRNYPKLSQQNNKMKQYMPAKWQNWPPIQ